MGRHFVHLVRHGQYDYSVKGKLGGSLNAVGREQAHYTSEALSEFQFNALHSSTMLRALATAAIIAGPHQGLKIRRTRMLWECVPTIPPRWIDFFERRAMRDPDFTPERVAAQKKVADRAFDRFFTPWKRKKDRHSILVAHGNIIRYLLCKALDVDPDAWGNMMIFHCSISRVVVDPDGSMMLLSHNETGHLPSFLRTDS